MTNHPNLNTPIRAALLLIVVRLSFHFADINWPPFQMVFLFLAVGTLIPLCIYAIWPRAYAPGFLKEVSSAMRIMAVFAVIMIAFIIVFYAFIDKEFFPEKQAEILKSALESNPESKHAELRKQVEDFFSLRNFSVLLLLGFMISSAFYAVFFTVLKRLIMRQK